jgi:hypothetical protein
MVITLVAAGIAVAAPTATAEVLFDHVDPTPSASIVSQFPVDAQTQGATAFDDFTVPPGEVWHPEHLFVDGAASGPATSTDSYFQINQNLGTPPTLATDLYAQVLSSGPGATYPDLDLDIHVGYVLPPGSYWLSARAQLPLGPSSNRWFWQANDEQFGELALWQENGAYGTGCVDSLKPRRTVCQPGSPPDQSFRIDGVRTPAEIHVVKAKARRHGHLRLMLELPSCCALRAKSKRMRVAPGPGPRDIGPYTIELKPKRPTLARLERGETVVAKVTLTTNPLLDGLPGRLDFPPVTVKKKLKL